MSTEKKSFILHFDQCEEAMSLPMDQRGWAFTALYEYARDCAEDPGLDVGAYMDRYPDMTPETAMACRFLCRTTQRETVIWNESRERMCRAAQSREQRRREAQQNARTARRGVSVSPPEDEEGL